MKSYKVDEIDSWVEAPVDSVQVWDPKFKNMNNEQIINSMDVANNWIPYGYDLFVICKSVCTVYVAKPLT